METPSIHQLRLAGFKVRVIHSRFYNLPFMGGSKNVLLTKFQRDEEMNEFICGHTDTVIGQPLAKGGETYIMIHLPDGSFCEGNAVCSKKENFCYKAGVKTALERALNGVRYFPE